jgi:hypothetical protein
MDKKMFYKASFTSVLQSAFLLFKGLVGFLLLISSKKNLVSRYARFRGVCSGIMWALDPKPETGYNPFISK